MNLMKRMLAPNLTQEERTELYNLTFQSGFKVFQKMLDDLCLRATEEVRRIDRTLPNYKEKLEAAHFDMCATHEIVEAIRQSFIVHSQNAIAEKEKEENAGTNSTRRVQAAQNHN